MWQSISTRSMGAGDPAGALSLATACWPLWTVSTWQPSACSSREATIWLTGLSSTSSTRSGTPPGDGREGSGEVRRSTALGSASSSWTTQRKVAPLARGALDGDVAAHQPGQAPRDREAQPRAPELPGGRRVGLGKGLEDLIELVGLDADAGVAHPHHEPQPRGLGGADVERHRDPAPLGGELDGVADQVVDDLAQPHVVALQAPGHRGAQAIVEGQALLPGPRLEQGHGAPQHLVAVEGHRRQRHLARLDLGKIEHVVEHRQQRAGRVMDDLGGLAQLGRGHLVDDQRRHAQYTVEGCPDLVAHRGQKRAFGLVGGLGRRLGPAQLFVGEPLGGQVLKGPQHPDDPVPPVPQRDLRGADQARRAVGQHVGLFEIEQRPARRDHDPVVGPVALGLGAPHHVVVGLAQQLVGRREPRVAGEGHVAAQITALRVLPEDALGHEIEGQLQHLGPIEVARQALVAGRGLAGEGQRLACQIVVLGGLVFMVSSRR